MAVLSSTSTPAEVLAEYRDTVSYEEDSDVAKARRHITAIGFILADPQSSSEFSRSMAYDTGALERQRDRARQYVAARTGSGRRRVRNFAPRGIF